MPRQGRAQPRFLTHEEVGRLADAGGPGRPRHPRPCFYRLAVRRTRGFERPTGRSRPTPSYRRQQRHRGRWGGHLDDAQDAPDQVRPVPAVPDRERLSDCVRGGPMRRSCSPVPRVACSGSTTGVTASSILRVASLASKGVTPHDLPAHRGQHGHRCGGERQGGSADAGTRLGGHDPRRLRRLFADDLDSVAVALDALVPPSAPQQRLDRPLRTCPAVRESRLTRQYGAATESRQHAHSAAVVTRMQRGLSRRQAVLATHRTGGQSPPRQAA